MSTHTDQAQEGTSVGVTSITLESGDESVTIPQSPGVSFTADDLARGDRGEAITADGVSGYVSKDPVSRPFVPPDESFADGDDFQKAPEIQKIGDALVVRWPELRHLQDANIEYRWKRAGGKSGGNATYGKCVKLSGLAKHFAGADFVVWIAADHLRESGWRTYQLEALTYHELKHIKLEVNEDETSPNYGEEKLVIVGHDRELFVDELKRYGAWELALQVIGEQYRQLAIAS